VAGSALAIIAGRGALPRLIAEDCVRRGRPYRVVTFEGVRLDWLDGHPAIPAVFEKPGRLFSDLRGAGCSEVTFAGGMARPVLDPRRFDLKMLRLAPRILGGLRGGDDATLRLLAGIFEDEGFVLTPAQGLLTDLLAPAGPLTRSRPSAADRADADRAAQIAAALGAADVGQAVVVAQGVCLGVESVQGTEALLDFVARTGARFRGDPDGGRGVLLKAPKPQQDRRFDVPSIGPETVAQAAAAGLAGIVVEGGGVLILERDRTVAAAEAAGLWIWGREAVG